MSVKMKSHTATLIDPSDKYKSMDPSSDWREIKQEKLVSLADIHKRLDSVRTLLSKPGVHSTIRMKAAGFQYTGNGDAAQCKDCELEISNWTSNMKPFDIHSQQRPDCSFVRSMVGSLSGNLSSTFVSSTTAIRDTSPVNEQENSSKHLSNTLLETDSLQQVRRRTFSHWPHRTLPSSTQMIEAGFFNCNVGDRVICIYCNIICQQWTPQTDDPCTVHKTLLPNCPYVKAKLVRPSTSPILNVNKSTTITTLKNQLSTSTNLDPLKSSDVVFTAACNPAYAELSKRHASFVTWPNKNLPSIDDLVRAGFFYTGTKNIVTCFYCNGSLQKWGPNDDPMVEHARWFRNCAYTKLFCDDRLYRKIQNSKRVQQESGRVYEMKDKAGQLLISDVTTLSKLLEARLDLPVSRRLLNQNFKLTVVKKCWEDQLLLKHDDFVSECDLYVACLILQKQIEHIDGKKENIIIPSVRMKQIREENRQRIHEQSSTTTNLTQSVSDNVNQNQPANSTPSHPCVLCLTEEKRLACLPCGHLATCIPCGISLRLCPICQEEIQAFVRIYI